MLKGILKRVYENSVWRGDESPVYAYEARLRGLNPDMESVQEAKIPNFRTPSKVMCKKNVIAQGILNLIPGVLIVEAFIIRERNLMLSNFDLCLALITSVAIGLLTADKQ
jgi:hypothetical protein